MHRETICDLDCSLNFTVVESDMNLTDQTTCDHVTNLVIHYPMLGRNKHGPKGTSFQVRSCYLATVITFSGFSRALDDIFPCL